MKKQIVITINETKSGWVGDICGKVGDNQSKEIQNIPAGFTNVLFYKIVENTEQIEQWMEQIG